MNIEGGCLRSPPLVFELGQGEVAQRGVDALVHVDLVKKSSQLTVYCGSQSIYSILAEGQNRLRVTHPGSGLGLMKHSTIVTL